MLGITFPVPLTEWISILEHIDIEICHWPIDVHSFYFVVVVVVVVVVVIGGGGGSPGSGGLGGGVCKVSVILYFF